MAASKGCVLPSHFSSHDKIIHDNLRLKVVFEGALTNPLHRATPVTVIPLLTPAWPNQAHSAPAQLLCSGGSAGRTSHTVQNSGACLQNPEQLPFLYTSSQHQTLQPEWTLPWEEQSESVVTYRPSDCLMDKVLLPWVSLVWHHLNHSGWVCKLISLHQYGSVENQ